MFRYCLLLVPFFFMACKSEGNQRTTTRKTSTATSYSDDNTTGDFYRRYAGTIGNQPVVMQLHRFGGSYSGSYQYLSQGKIIWLNEENNGADPLLFTEYSPEDRNAPTSARLALQFHSNNLGGEWISADGQKRLPVKLDESYVEGSYRLLAAHMEDSARLVPDKPAPYATASYKYLLPADGTPGFLGRSLIGMVGDRQTPVQDVDQALQTEIAAYFQRYRSEAAPMLQEDLDTSALFAFNYSTEKSLEVLSNGDGWLIVRDLSGEYTGGAHGYYASGFSNIDVEGGKIWNVSDIVTDTNALRPMLNDAAIRYFHLGKGDGMADRLLVDEVPATPNVFISPTGIYFVYNPYEIASYADGEILLFLPYTKISNLLTEAFRARMKLGTRAGVAALTSGHNSRAHGRTRL